MTAQGQCRLCGEMKRLHESHVWPRCGYKRWVANNQRGGEFCDVTKRRRTNRQYKRRWFCSQCEGTIGRGETEFTKLLDATKGNDPLYYGPSLTDFATSVSLRTALFTLENGEFRPEVACRLRDAIRHWKRFVLGKVRTLLPFSQHAFYLPDDGSNWHQIMGGQVHHTAQLVVSQVGPLMVIGLLNRQTLTARDRKTWKQTEIELEGGTLRPLSEWKEDGNVTRALINVLNRQQCKLAVTASVFDLTK